MAIMVWLLLELRIFLVIKAPHLLPSSGFKVIGHIRSPGEKTHPANEEKQRISLVDC